MERLRVVAFKFLSGFMTLCCLLLSDARGGEFLCAPGDSFELCSQCLDRFRPIFDGGNPVHPKPPILNPPVDIPIFEQDPNKFSEGGAEETKGDLKNCNTRCYGVRKASCEGCTRPIVRWNPQKSRRTLTDSQYCNDPCLDLIHEMTHAYQAATGTDPGKKVAKGSRCEFNNPFLKYVLRLDKPNGTPLEQTEADAVEMENLVLAGTTASCCCPSTEYYFGTDGQATCTVPGALGLAREHYPSRVQDWEQYGCPGVGSSSGGRRAEGYQSGGISNALAVEDLGAYCPNLCGNGRVDVGLKAYSEECDPSANASTPDQICPASLCRKADCQCSCGPVGDCGNGILDPGEQCDPGDGFTGPVLNSCQSCGPAGSPKACQCVKPYECFEPGKQCYCGPYCIGGNTGYCTPTPDGINVCHTDNRIFCFQKVPAFCTSGQECRDRGNLECVKNDDCGVPWVCDHALWPIQQACIPSP